MGAEALQEPAQFDCKAGQECRGEHGATDACTQDDFCHGCKAYICEACAPDGPWGGHDVDEHLQHARELLWWDKDGDEVNE